MVVHLGLRIKMGKGAEDDVDRCRPSVIPGREANPESKDSPMCDCTSEVCASRIPE
jgi:hypothetical protein